MKNKRYKNLLKTIYKERCRSIMEIGTFDGVHALQMIATANIFHPANRIEYYGFDLFDALTEEDLQKELSKKPPAFEEVKQKLEKTGSIIHLYKGYSNETLPMFLEENRGAKKIDFVFIDGGHSIETISSDWNYIKKIMIPKTVVIFDDYYNNSKEEVRGVGCQSIINNLDRKKYHVEKLEPEDRFKKDWGILRVQMVKVRLK